MLIRIACLCCCALLLAAEDWDPHAHPAELRREIAGYTEAPRSMHLAAEYAGRIASIAVEEGDRITADEPVVALDDRIARLQRDQAATAVEQRRVGLERARQALRLAQREERYQQSELARIERLAGQGQAPEQELDLTRFRHDSATIGHAAAEAELAAAEQALASSETALALAEERLARHRLAGPAGWTVTARLAEPGSVVTPQQPVLELADVRSLLVTCSLSENEIRALRAAPQVELRFPQQGDAQATATVHRVAVVFDPLTRKRTVELLLPAEAAPEASGGLEVRFALSVPDPAGGLRVPLGHVRWISEQPFVTGDDGIRRSPTVLRREPDFLVVAPNSLPRGVRLLPPSVDGETP